LLVIVTKGHVVEYVKNKSYRKQLLLPKQTEPGSRAAGNSQQNSCSM